MMFYIQLFTSKRGSLAKIWLAAHWERKITKAHVFECNLESTVKDIISPQFKIGLRTSGHLLLGVVRIYSRKAKYLLADCNAALDKLVAFRPGQTDMPAEGLEATLKAITLMEDFTDFETHLPQSNNIDDVDPFSLNQCRTEEITIKEDLGNGFLSLVDFGDESQLTDTGLLDMSYHSLAYHGDAFGDEQTEFDLIGAMQAMHTDFMTGFGDRAALTDLVKEEPHNEKPESPTMSIQQEDANRSEPVEDEAPTLSENTLEVEANALSETTLLANEEEAFALEPVAVTPTSENKKGKRKRRLVVDQSKELSNEAIRQQLADFSDLVAPLYMAPPTCQLMQWKESGGADKLFGKLCVPVINPQIQQLFRKNILRGKTDVVDEKVHPEEMRKERQEVQRDSSVLTKTEDLSILHESVEPEQMSHSAELSPLRHGKDNSPESFLELPHGVSMSGIGQGDSRMEFSHLELPSEDSMCVHPSGLERGTPSTIIRTQSMLDSQDVEERRITSRAQKLLNNLKSQSNDSNTTFSLRALCEGSIRSQAAATFFSLLVLKKQEALDLHQNTPYGDIVVTPGPRFRDL